MQWVMDCSFSSALFLPDEESSRISSFFTGLSKKDELIVPTLWWQETANVLAVSLRRNRLKRADIDPIITLFERMDIITDSTQGAVYVKALCDIAQSYQISAYDAVYLELALRIGASLATLDDPLRGAAVKAGMRVWVNSKK